MAEYERVWVIGPQRSGTRIAAKIITLETGFRYVDETFFSIDSLSNLWRYMNQLHPGHKYVIQGPAITASVPFIAESGDLVVFMHRNIKDVVASEKRIGWKYNQVELWKLGAHARGSSAAEKNRLWRARWRPALKKAGIDTVDLKYERLSKHKMWKPKSEREKFKWNQTT